MKASPRPILRDCIGYSFGPIYSTHVYISPLHSVCSVVYVPIFPRWTGRIRTPPLLKLLSKFFFFDKTTKTMNILVEFNIINGQNCWRNEMDCFWTWIYSQRHPHGHHWCNCHNIFKSKLQHLLPVFKVVNIFWRNRIIWVHKKVRSPIRLYNESFMCLSHMMPVTLSRTAEASLDKTLLSL